MLWLVLWRVLGLVLRLVLWLVLWLWLVWLWLVLLGVDPLTTGVRARGVLMQGDPVPPFVEHALLLRIGLRVGRRAGGIHIDGDDLLAGGWLHAHWASRNGLYTGWFWGDCRI